jgi:putative glutamine amidotransferase
MPSPSDRPAIGLTLGARSCADEEQRMETATTYYRQALEAAGAAVAELRPGADLSSALPRLQGLLLAGGGDVDPARYGEAPHHKLGRVDRDRDELEISLVRLARKRALPVLGVCRGAQVIGVATGGRLLQDISSQLAGTCIHSPAEGEQPTLHRVQIAPDSKLSALLGVTELRVNSYHHQANATLGPGMRAVAWSDDGVVEAIEADGPGFLLGVQWHPERMVAPPSPSPGAAASARLFSGFVAAATGVARPV